MAVYANISIDQGSDFASIVTVEGSDGLIFNLDGYTPRGQIRKSYASVTAVDFTTSVQSAIGGTIAISLTHDQTSAMKPGRYLYDLEVVHDTSGIVTRVVEGQLEISAGVTQPS